MSRKRFSADELAQQARVATADDLVSPPRREASLTDVVRTMWPNIKARREAGHSFSRIAEWLTSLGYAINGATLGVYCHRISKAADSIQPAPHLAAAASAQHSVSTSHASGTPSAAADPQVRPRAPPTAADETARGVSTRTAAPMPRRQA